MQLLFRAFLANTTTALGVLTDATDKRVSVHYNGPGTGSFRINRHSSQFAWCEPGNYVRVYIDSLATTPIFAFFIESGNDTVVSRNEEGGETFQRGGRGALAYLERAIIDNSSTFGRYADTSWTWTNPTHGQIVKELIDDAQVRSTLPLLTMDFTNTVESGGGTWTDIIGIYELPVGLDLLQMLQRQQSAGLVARMSPAFVLSCSEVIGTDLSGTITFEAGVNISEEVTRDVMASAAKSRMLVQGTTTAGTPFFRWVSDGATETALGDRREGFVSYQATADTGTIDRVGLQAIRRLKRRHDGLSVLGVMTDEVVPFADYQPGDTVTINVPGVWSNLEAPITSIVLFDVDNGEADCALEFEDIAFEPLQLKDRSETTTGTGGGTGGGGGAGAGGTGGGGGATAGAGCGGCPPWTGDEIAINDGAFFDSFGREATPGWDTPSTSGHVISGGGAHVRPGYGALSDGSPAARGIAEYVTTGVAEFTAGRWRLEMDFEVRAYDSADYAGDTNFDAADAGLNGFGIGFLFTSDATLNQCYIYADGDYLLRGGGTFTSGNISGFSLAEDTSYTLIWTVDSTAATSSLQIAGHLIEHDDAAGAPDSRNLTVSMVIGDPPDNWAIAHVTRLRSFALGGVVGPEPGQQVNNEAVGTGDGFQTFFVTAYPWRPGGIVVRVNGIDVTDPVDVLVPEDGEIEFATAPGLGSEITVSYVAGP